MALARAAAARLRTSVSSVLLPASARLLATAAAAAEAEPWPVVVVGAGPTGLTAALLLAKYGVPSLVLERSAALTTHPQAHFINHRTMEVLRAIDRESGGWSIYVLSLGDRAACLRHAFGTRALVGLGEN